MLNTTVSQKKPEALPVIQFVGMGLGNTRQDVEKVDKGWVPDAFIKFVHDVWQEYPVQIKTKRW